MDHGQILLQKVKERLFKASSLVIVIWLMAVWWGERGVFSRAVENCQWNQWERWSPQATPHHVLLVADPQLVDPHTYPGRPWPLSSLTIMYTDIYLRRSYYYFQSRLQPDSTLFLGDLFDGGREWATAETSSPEQRYRQYGQGFWIKEYRRFSTMFLKKWLHGPTNSLTAPFGKRLIASVPGNHDLGFARGIQPAVKSRFDAFFGPLNRVDVLGNHSIVSLDTVSLSALDQSDETGSSGAGDGSATATAVSRLWQPVEDFLSAAKSLRRKAVHHEAASMGLVDSPERNRLRSPTVVNLADDIDRADPVETRVSSSLFPTIILTHVPFYRDQDTSCGPLREGRPSIALAAGYQYQNVLTKLISSDIVKHLSASEIVQIYSGDDHDYCEIEHSEFTGRIREITVKSMSWAMGVRRPGVQLASLWNPISPDQIGATGNTVSTPRDTIQNHLCLLPDQLRIFIRYAQVLLLSLVVLAGASFRYSPSAANQQHLEKSQPLLPLTTQPPSSASSSSSDNENRLNSRSSGKLGGYGNIPESSRSSSPTKQKTDPFAPAPGSHLINQAINNTYMPPGENSKDSDDWGMPNHKHKRRKGRLGHGGPPRTKFRHFTRSLWEVAVPVLAFYLWALWVFP